jgi:hypothetical protein
METIAHRQDLIMNVPWTGIVVGLGLVLSLVGGYARHRIYSAVQGTLLYRPRPNDGAFQKYAELVERGGAPAWPLRLKMILWPGVLLIFAGVSLVR